MIGMTPRRCAGEAQAGPSPAAGELEAWVAAAEPTTPDGLRWRIEAGELVAVRDEGIFQRVLKVPAETGEQPLVSLTEAWSKRTRPVDEYTALLNLAYWWHEPGTTLTPAGKGKGRRWLQSRDPKRYRKPTDRELINLVFPMSADKARRRLLSRAEEALAALAKAGEVRMVDGRLLPPKPDAGE